MLRKVVIGGVALAVLVPTAWLGIEHLRGEARLAAEVQDIEKRGGTLDILQLVSPLPRGASNGMPLLLSAAQRLQEAGAQLPPAIQMVAPGRATPPNRLLDWPGSGKSGPATNTWATVRAWLDAHADDLEDFRSAFSFPERRQAVDYGAGFVNLRLPHLAPVKGSAVLLSLTTAEAAHRGDLDAALADLECLRTLEADLASEPVLISQLVRIAIASIANSRIWAVARAQPWTEPQLARIQATLPGTNFVAALVRSLEGERALSYTELRRQTPEVLSDILVVNEAAGAPDDPGGGAAAAGTIAALANLAETYLGNVGSTARKRVFFPVWHFAWSDQAIAECLRCMDSLIATNRAARSFAEARMFDLRPWISAPSLYAGFRRSYVRALIPAVHMTASKAFRIETERNLNDADLAILRYQVRHGQPPASLADLVPEFLAAVPVDAMDGQPLRYRRTSDGSYLLWSVGENGIDDGGDATSERLGAGSFAWWTGKDLVWPRPASDAEVSAWREEQAAKTTKNRP